MLPKIEFQQNISHLNDYVNPNNQTFSNSEPKITKGGLKLPILPVKNETSTVTSTTNKNIETIGLNKHLGVELDNQNDDGNETEDEGMFGLQKPTKNGNSYKTKN